MIELKTSTTVLAIILVIVIGIVALMWLTNQTVDDVAEDVSESAENVWSAIFGFIGAVPVASSAWVMPIALIIGVVIIVILIASSKKKKRGGRR